MKNLDRVTRCPPLNRTAVALGARPVGTSALSLANRFPSVTHAIP